jgi:hypothetical protein
MTTQELKGHHTVIGGQRQLSEILLDKEMASHQEVIRKMLRKKRRSHQVKRGGGKRGANKAVLEKSIGTAS